MLRAGIVGLPNVGKSTLFNALTAQQAALAANYPFATIEPNVGIVAVPDDRLEPLAKIVKSERIVPATIEFVDVAGLVRGASKGEGLGNQFLAHIRETDLVVQVVRCFEDESVVHVEGSVDPRRDVELYQGASYKAYRGMGSLGAMSERHGSADRYFQDTASEL